MDNLRLADAIAALHDQLGSAVKDLGDHTGCVLASIDLDLVVQFDETDSGVVVTVLSDAGSAANPIQHRAKLTLRPDPYSMASRRTHAPAADSGHIGR